MVGVVTLVRARFDYTRIDITLNLIKIDWIIRELSFVTQPFQNHLFDSLNRLIETTMVRAKDMI